MLQQQLEAIERELAELKQKEEEIKKEQTRIEAEHAAIKQRLSIEKMTVERKLKDIQDKLRGIPSKIHNAKSNHGSLRNALKDLPGIHLHTLTDSEGRHSPTAASLLVFDSAPRLGILVSTCPRLDESSITEYMFTCKVDGVPHFYSVLCPCNCCTHLREGDLVRCCQERGIQHLIIMNGPQSDESGHLHNAGIQTYMLPAITELLSTLTRTEEERAYIKSIFTFYEGPVPDDET